MMWKAHLAFGLLLLSGVLAISTWAQQPDAQRSGSSDTGPSPYTLYMNGRGVVLDVVVTNAKGEVVPGLTKDDFLIYENKVLQSIQYFDSQSSHAKLQPAPSIRSTAELDRREPNVPVTLIVLDEINTRFQDEAFARYSVKKFLNQQGNTLDQPTLLGAVDLEHFTLLHDYTTSKQDLLSALEHHTVGPAWRAEGTNWRYQRFKASFASLMEIAEATTGHPGHKSLLWVGRGFPPFDQTSLSDEDSDTLKRIITSCTDALRDSRVTLYTLDPAGVSTEAADWNDDGFADDPFDGELDFNKMAAETGGHAFYGRNDVDRLIETSARDGANFYTLSYTPSVSESEAKPFHNIRVVMRNPALRAETRRGYYSQSTPTSAGASAESQQVSRQTFDLALAAQSMMVYDAIHMAVKRVNDGGDQFRLSLNSGDLVWTQSGSQKLLTKVTVVVESFDKKGAVVGQSMKVSTLQAGDGAKTNTPDIPTVSLFASVPTKSPAVRVRFLVRSEGNQKLGTVNFSLVGKTPEGEVSN